MVDWNKVYDALATMQEIMDEPDAPAELRVATTVFLMHCTLIDMPEPGEVERQDEARERLH
jgi:hypothetical protein